MENKHQTCQEIFRRNQEKTGKIRKPPEMTGPYLTGPYEGISELNVRFWIPRAPKFMLGAERGVCERYYSRALFVRDSKRTCTLTRRELLINYCENIGFSRGLRSRQVSVFWYICARSATRGIFGFSRIISA